ncbi:uncharacterized protein LOC143204506 isoform X2 [Rhynchophorus ferrugineus]|uniref:uncharacterized protein LOC143204506 isoform X2 n=1 Tax=Rhynchophorus ferrugineus TaxID=354439 RepID=UPI003FCDBCDD
MRKISVSVSCALVVMMVVVVVVSIVECNEISCGRKPFVCLDEEKFYQCVKSSNQQYIVQGNIQVCPIGTSCTESGNEACDDGISKEYLTDDTLLFKFGDKEGRRHIIDD